MHTQPTDCSTWTTKMVGNDSRYITMTREWWTVRTGFVSATTTICATTRFSVSSTTRNDWCWPDCRAATTVSLRWKKLQATPSATATSLATDTATTSTTAAPKSASVEWRSPSTSATAATLQCHIFDIDAGWDIRFWRSSRDCNRTNERRTSLFVVYTTVLFHSS